MVLGQPSRKPERPLQVALGMTAFTYVGDLSTDNSGIYRFHPGINLGLQLDGPKSLQVQFNLTMGRFWDQLEDGPVQSAEVRRVNRFVETRFFGGDLRLKYRFFKNSRLQPFVAAGAGLLVFSPRDEQGNFLSDALLSRNEGESYNTAIPQLPIVMGISYKLRPNISLVLDYTYRVTPSDYLDNIGELGQRNGNDAIHALQLALAFRFTPTNGQVAIPDSSIKMEEAPDPDSLPLTELDNQDSTDTVVAEERPQIPEADPLDELDEIDRYALSTKDFFYYRIKEGDDLEFVYRNFGVKPHIIKQINGFPNDDIPARHLLKVPDLRDKLGLILDSNIDIIDPENIGNGSRPRLDDNTAEQDRNESAVEFRRQAELIRKAIAENRYKYHRVEEGETLGDISMEYDVPRDVLIRINHLSGIAIYPGAYLRIPDTEVVK